MSAVEGSESIVANGADKGLTLPDMVRKYKEDLVGEANYARFGNKFPLLIKFIDAKLDLSIQVHPGDELAKKRHNSFGKNEMWYVIAADQGAKLISGFAEQITPKEYKERVYNGTFADVLQTCAIKPGDVFYVPAGRVHGIGAGAFVAEIQQTSDITYRILITIVRIRMVNQENCIQARPLMPLILQMCRTIFVRSTSRCRMNR